MAPPTIRDLILAAVILAMAVAWGVDRGRLVSDNRRLENYQKNSDEWISRDIKEIARLQERVVDLEHGKQPSYYPATTTKLSPHFSPGK